MAFKFFSVSIQDHGAAEAELNAFLRSHRVLAVDRRWIEQGASSFWCFCVDFLERPTAPQTAGTPSGNRPKVDYKELLSTEEFALFSQLRNLRKEIAQAEAVPVYTVLTNEQLAQIVRTKAATKSDLEKIAGVGDARVEKYGPRILEFISQRGSTGAATDGTTV